MSCNPNWLKDLRTRFHDHCPTSFDSRTTMAWYELNAEGLPNVSDLFID